MAWSCLDRLIQVLSFNHDRSGISYLFSFSVCGLYHKHITIVNDNSRVINNLETSLTDDARVINYDCHMFIAQATLVVCQCCELAPRRCHFCPAYLSPDL
jgi:hypothetical protein